MITKGMRPTGETLIALPDYVASEVKHRAGLGLTIAAIGGPCIAGELAARRQTGTVIAAHDLAFARRLCAMLRTDYYHPRASADVIGVELCAAFKNFFAIGVGWAAGHLDKSSPAENQARNHNAAAILFDQAIAEMLTLTRAHGGGDASVWGMPGAGDLYVTCQAGRNSRLGVRLGQGMTYREVKTGPMKDDTIEGAELGIAVAATLEHMMASAKLAAAALPLTRALLRALTQNKPLAMPWAEFHPGDRPGLA
jgi:glycerol-3-phosphate dehydrogenase (NAD(P)+)